MPLPFECYSCGKHMFTISFDGVRCLNVNCPRFDIIIKIHECQYDDNLDDDYWSDSDEDIAEEL